MTDQPFPTFSPLSRETSRRNRAFLYVALFLILVGGTIYFGNRYLSGSAEKKDSTGVVTPTPTPIESVPTPTLEAVSPTPTGKITPTSPQKTTPTPTGKKTIGIEKSELTIQVLNGSGTKGAAGKAATLLRDAGYTVSSTGNADTFDYTKTTIQLKKSKNQFAAELKKDLSESYTLDQTIQTLAETSSVDAIVIVGAE